jgi:hypothetical protein
MATAEECRRLALKARQRADKYPHERDALLTIAAEYEELAAAKDAERARAAGPQNGDGG